MTNKDKLLQKAEYEKKMGMDVERHLNQKEYTIYGIQSIHHEATITASSYEEALKKADEHHADYHWDECHVGDWTYE